MLSLGGELRERAEAFENPGFGLKHSHDNAFLHRVLAFGDLCLGNSSRAFVQLNYANESGRQFGPAATDINKLDLAQGFLDIGLPLENGSLKLRSGRQELSFGSQRLISVRDSPNLRRIFDGARVMWEGQAYRIDALIVRPVRVSSKAFDDTASTTESLAGIYTTMPTQSSSTKVDIYYLEYRRDNARLSVGIANERRHTMGTRLFGTKHQWDWNVEAVYQSGNFAERDISAWTLASDFGLTLDNAPFTPRLGLKLDVASGTRHPEHGVVGTFNALYPKLPYFSDANLIAPANIVDLHPDIKIAAGSAVTLDLGWDFLWRETTHDAIYAPPLVPIAATAGRGSHFIGHQIIAGTDWQLDRHLALAMQFVHFASGRTLRLVRGRPVNFAFAAVSYRF